MRPLLIILSLASSLAAAQDDRATIVDTTRRAGIQCRLQHQGDAAQGYAVAFDNRSGRGARVDYRVLSRIASTWTGTVILRPADGAGQPTGVMTVALPAGTDYFGADLMQVTPGTVRERTETRTAADGSTTSVTVLELVEDGPTVAEREQADAARNRQETERLRQEVATLRQQQEASDAARQTAAATPVVVQVQQTYVEMRPMRHHDDDAHHPVRPQPVAPEPRRELTWEEQRDQELANERKVWKNF